MRQRDATAAKMLSQPESLVTTWIIGQRAAAESLRDRTTAITSIVFAVIVPVLIAGLLIGPQAGQATSHGKETELGDAMALYLLLVGLGPASGAISIAAGVFAGELEKGNLAPLLATPASNLAIFAGKVLGAVLPALLYAGVGEAIYLLATLAIAGPAKLQLLPLSLSLAMLLLIPAITVLAATVASLISSRVRTYTSAQMVTSLALLPIMSALVGVAITMRHWGPWWPLVAVAAMVTLDTLLLIRSASRWRREEVLARN